MLLLEDPDAEVEATDDWDPTHILCPYCVMDNGVFSLCGEHGYYDEFTLLTSEEADADCAMCLTYTHCPKCGAEIDED